MYQIIDFILLVWLLDCSAFGISGRVGIVIVDSKYENIQMSHTYGT